MSTEQAGKVSRYSGIWYTKPFSFLLLESLLLFRSLSLWMNEQAGRQPARYPGINSDLYLFSGQKYKFQAQQRKHFNLIETCYFVFVFSKRYCFHYSLGYFFSLVVKTISYPLFSLSLSPLSLSLSLSLSYLYIYLTLSLSPHLTKMILVHSKSEISCFFSIFF